MRDNVDAAMPAARKVRAALRRTEAVITATLTGLLFFAGFGPVSAPAQVGGDSRADLAATQQEIRSFAKVINKFLEKEFSSSFAVQPSKGVYLQGYGVAFSFVVNIHRAVITPFGEVPMRDADSPEQKRRRIEDMREKLVRLLQGNGDTFRQLRKDENITIVVFVEDRSFPDEENQNKTLVLSVLKRDVDELARREDRAREFKQRMRIVEY